MYKSMQCAKERVCDVALWQRQSDSDGVQGALNWESEQFYLDVFQPLPGPMSSSLSTTCDTKITTHTRGVRNLVFQKAQLFFSDYTDNVP